LASTTGTIATLNSTTGTIATLNSTTGTIGTINSTTGTITNLSTTLAGDFTISSGTGTLGTTGATAGTYGSVTAIPFLTVDAKGRITSATTGTFSSTPADGSITPAKLSQPFTRGTAVASTSGTAIDFTGIPSWVKRITVMFDGLSNGGTTIQIQFGDSGGIETTGYVSGNQGADISSGFMVAFNPAGGYLQYGAMVFTNLSGNTWVQEGVALAISIAIQPTAGSKTLSGTLDRVRITANGVDTFDAGIVNIMYEG
jgi:hypothetical protein